MMLTMKIRPATILYIPPNRVADWDESMAKSPQSYSPKV